jgi:hypothetical protein
MGHAGLVPHRAERDGVESGARDDADERGAQRVAASAPRHLTRPAGLRHADTRPASTAVTAVVRRRRRG